MNGFTVSVAAASYLNPSYLFKIFYFCWSSSSSFPRISHLSFPSFHWPPQMCHPVGGSFLMSLMTSEALPPCCWPARCWERSDLTASIHRATRSCCAQEASSQPPSGAVGAGDALHNPSGTLPVNQLMLQKVSHTS